MITREDLEAREAKFLAPYAFRSTLSKGRLHKEPEHKYRTAYQRDRDRIIYSTAFRRLEYKTQVFVNHEGDYYRTRLTHTLEVAQIARTIARTLGLNEDLVETISLAHDLGHTPFGHSGEDALRDIMVDHGGFDHNTQGLRVVDFLEHIYPDFNGLNLTYEVREGIIKHSTPFDLPRPAIPFESEGSPILETQVVDIADEIAYDNHDLDDGITSGLMEESQLLKLGLWRQAHQEVKRQNPGMTRDVRKHQIVRLLINKQVTDLINETQKRIKKFKICRPDDARKLSERVVTFGPEMSEQRRPLRGFLMTNLYNHYRVVRMANKANRFITELFKVYIDKTDQLPPMTRSRIKKEDPYRVICDYIAGMTDRYALDEYKKFFEPYERV